LMAGQAILSEVILWAEPLQLRTRVNRRLPQPLTPPLNMSSPSTLVPPPTPPRLCLPTLRPFPSLPMPQLSNPLSPTTPVWCLVTEPSPLVKSSRVRAGSSTSPLSKGSPIMRSASGLREFPTKGPSLNTRRGDIWRLCPERSPRSTTMPLST